MSDAGRKNFSDKAAESLRPEGDKTYYDKAKEGVTDAADRVAAAVQPNEQKSGTQQAFDSFKDGKDEGTAKSYAETAKEYVETAKEKISETINSFSHDAGEQTGKK